MPTITTRGNITATSYGFGKAGSGVTGSYFLTTLNTSGGQFAVSSIYSITNAELLFAGNYSSSYYGKLTNTGTLSWVRLTGSNGSSGVITSDGAGTAYSAFGYANGPGAYNKYAESSGTFTAGRAFSGSTYPFSDKWPSAAVLSGSTTYLHLLGRGYDAGYSYFGVIPSVLPLTSGSGNALQIYSTVDTAFNTYSCSITPLTSTTSSGVYCGNNANAVALAITCGYSGTTTPTLTSTFAVRNSVTTYGSDTFLAGVCDTSGNRYLLGEFGYDGASFSPFFFVMKVNSAGTVQWARKLESAAGGYPSSAVLDSTGNVYFAYFNGTYTCLTKYTTSGTFVWSRRINTGSQDGYAPPTISLDSSSFWLGMPLSSSLSIVLRAPVDGTKTGTYGGYTYSVGITSDSAFTGYSITSESITTNATAFSTIASGSTSSASSLTVSTTTIP